jgi:hypothetical protein
MTIEFLNDTKGKIKAVQIPIKDWDKITMRLKKYEQALQLKVDLTEAFGQVKQMQQGKIKKQSLTSFLNEL